MEWYNYIFDTVIFQGKPPGVWLANNLALQLLQYCFVQFKNLFFIFHFFSWIQLQRLEHGKISTRRYGSRKRWPGVWHGSFQSHEVLYQPAEYVQTPGFNSLSPTWHLKMLWAKKANKPQNHRRRINEKLHMNVEQGKYKRTLWLKRWSFFPFQCILWTVEL